MSKIPSDPERQSYYHSEETPCKLCTSLRNEIDKARTNGERDREKVLNMLLNGHVGACHLL
jgi:hypothetical protein